MRLRKDTVQKTVLLAGQWRSDQSDADTHTAGIALATFLNGLSHQELIELMAVMSVGRGDPGSDNFQTLVNNIHLTAARIVDYLMEKPYLGEDLEKGMGKVGLGTTGE
jgi:hypothetical protein